MVRVVNTTTGREVPSLYLQTTKELLDYVSKSRHFGDGTLEDGSGYPVTISRPVPQQDEDLYWYPSVGEG